MKNTALVLLLGLAACKQGENKKQTEVKPERQLVSSEVVPDEAGYFSIGKKVYSDGKVEKGKFLADKLVSGESYSYFPDGSLAHLEIQHQDSAGVQIAESRMYSETGKLYTHRLIIQKPGETSPSSVISILDFGQNYGCNHGDKLNFYEKVLVLGKIYPVKKNFIGDQHVGRISQIFYKFPKKTLSIL